jgi:hypothetical protein
MSFKHELETRLSAIQHWLNANKIGATEEKTKSIAREIFWSLMNNDIELGDIVAIKDHINRCPFTIQEGNIWTHLLDYFTPLVRTKYVAFFRDISELTPCGLNTSPNACCGKFELLYRMLRPLSRQPKKGDIVDEDKIFELKGSEVRISDTELTGTEYKKKCTKIFEGHIAGNMVTKGGLKGVNVYEIEKPQHRLHYQTEFAKDVTTAKRLLREYFDENGWGCTTTEIDSMFSASPPDISEREREEQEEQEDPIETLWHQDILQKIILREMFIKYQAKMSFDKMYIFGDGTNVKIISTPEDLEKVQIVADYFRINQPANVGYYVV